MIVNSEFKNVVLLHGALGTKNDLLPIKNILQTRYNVFSFNFNGHGDALLNNNKSFGIKSFSEDLKTFLDDNNLKSTSLFGYSMGGYVALYFAMNYPEQINKIFTLGTKFHWNEDFANKQAGFLNAEKIKEKIPSFAEYLENKHQLNDWRNVVRLTAEMMKDLGRNPLLSSANIPAIKTPVLITIGDKDDMVTKEESEETASLLPNGNFSIIPETPHPIEKTNHSNIANALIEWLR